MERFGCIRRRDTVNVALTPVEKRIVFPVKMPVSFAIIQPTKKNDVAGCHSTGVNASAGICIICWYCRGLFFMKVDDYRRSLLADARLAAETRFDGIMSAFAPAILLYYVKRWISSR